MQDKPIYLNETGLATTGDTVHAERKQCVDLVRKMAFTMSRGAISYNWYDLRDDGNRANNHEDRMGLITHDFHVKPSYIAYNNFVGVLRGYRFVKQFKAEADQWVFLFEKDGQYVLVGWAQQPYAVGQMVLHSDAKQVTEVDILGNIHVLPRLSDGSVVIGLEAQPAYWVFEKSTVAPGMANSLIALSGVGAWLPGQENHLKFTFTNPLKQDTKYIFHVQMPRELGGAKLQFEKTIAPDKSVVMTLPVGLIHGDVDYTQSFTCTLDYQDTQYQIAGKCQLPIQWAGVIYQGDFSAKPNFILDKQEQVMDKYRSDPYNRHRVWFGPKDLSAQVWLACDDTYLKVRVNIIDDKHVQSNPNNELWRSDCIQLAMQVPGQDGMWQIDLARSDDGKPVVYPSIAPVGFDTSKINESLMTTTLHNDQLVYDIKIPLSTMQLTSAELSNGIYLSMLVNEDDGEGREGWIALSTGIGAGKDPSSYPFFIAQTIK